MQVAFKSLPAVLIIVVALAATSCVTQSYPPVVPATTEAYKKAVEDRLGPIWYEQVRLNGEGLSVGTVEATFRIPADGGSVQRLRIISNTGNQIDELTVRIALQLLRVPPIPTPVLSTLPEPYLYFEESFTIYDNRDGTSTKLLPNR